MAFLELKIPPVALVLLCALAMWGISVFAPSPAFPFPWSNAIAMAFVFAGGCEAVAWVGSGPEVSGALAVDEVP